MDDQLKVRDALQAFYGTESLGQDAYVAKINYADFKIFKLPFPNLKKRREIVYLHDINHILSGYDTSWIGEGEVAAWELASGFPKHCWVGYFYAPVTFAIGLLLNPARVFRAFLRGRRERNSCYANLGKEELFDLSVKDLRVILGQ
jgi:hypothetical protein